MLRAGAFFCLQMRVNYNALFTLGPCSIGCRPMFCLIVGRNSWHDFMLYLTVLALAEAMRDTLL